MANKKRLIDANRIPYHKSGFPKVDGFDSRLDWAFREDIDKLPTVDAVEVVRCKECKHYRESEHPERKGIKFCYRLKDRNGEHIGYNYSDNDFCSYGEKREA